jgi:hypothetical protein
VLRLGQFLEELGIQELWQEQGIAEVNLSLVLRVQEFVYSAQHHLPWRELPIQYQKVVFLDVVSKHGQGVVQWIASKPSSLQQEPLVFVPQGRV